MSYSTILVYLDEEDAVGRVMPVAIQLARRYGAHLLGLHVRSAVDSMIVRASGGAPDGATSRTQAAFDAAIAEAGDVSADWEIQDSDAPEVVAELVEAGRTCDLIIMPKSSEKHGLRNSNAVMGNLIMDVGRPVLLVPSRGAVATAGERVLVAWNGSRESTRAMFDALPILKTAQEVRLFGVDEESERNEGRMVRRVTSMLERHGVNVTAERVGSISGSIGNTLLNRATDRGSDLIVMGGYGRSRLREFMFGGASRDLLATMTVPVLMSH